MSEFWLCFNCCIAEQPQPKRRRRIDRSMIGEPTNFVHTAHVGSGDLFSGMNSWIQEPPQPGRNTVHPVELQTWSQRNNCSQCWTVKKSHYGWSQT
uniref:CDC42 small effector protein 2 n=1 Tax=Equus caballus TaxID=9796 RepID=F6TCM7_HORSE